jgi:hypothetical protein
MAEIYDNIKPGDMEGLRVKLGLLTDTVYRLEREIANLKQRVSALENS